MTVKLTGVLLNMRIKMKILGYIFVLMSIYNCAYANLNYSDSTTIVCIFRTPDKPTSSIFIPSIKKWKVDFSKSVFINSTKKINDSTWELKIETPKDNFNQLYHLAVVGRSTYEVFLDSKPERLLLVIDSTNDEMRKPYKIIPANKDKFWFGIEWQNATESYPVPHDSAANSNQINEILKKAEEIRRKYRKEILKSSAFASFVNIQILRTLRERIRSPYKETVKGKFLMDSLKIIFKSDLRKPTIFSFNSIWVGRMLLLGDIAAKSNYLAFIKKVVKDVNSNRYKDFLIFNNFCNASYVGISKEELKGIFNYSKEEIKDPELAHYLIKEFKKYNNLHQPLPENIMADTKIKDSAGNLSTLKQLITSLINKGKKKVLIDFWASWCGPCKQEITINKEFIDSLQRVDTSFAYIFFSIDVPERYSAAETFAKQQRFQDGNFFLVGADKSTLYNYLQINTIPYHLLVDLETFSFKPDFPSLYNKDSYINILTHKPSP